MRVIAPSKFGAPRLSPKTVGKPQAPVEPQAPETIESTAQDVRYPNAERHQLEARAKDVLKDIG